MKKRCATCKFGEKEYIHDWNARFPHFSDSIIACSMLKGRECVHQGYLLWEASQEALNNYIKNLDDFIEKDEMRI